MGRRAGRGGLRTGSSPVIDIDGRSWEDYLADRSSNFRSQLRRKERKLVREHGLQYRLCDDPDRLHADMETLIRLHKERWGEQSSSFAGARRGFHLDLARAALEGGWLRLWLAEADGRPVAGWYGFRLGGTDWYYQAGRDPGYERTSVGLVLLAHTVREACNDGLGTYALLRGDESYKDRFATRNPTFETLLVGRGVGGASRRSAFVPPRGCRVSQSAACWLPAARRPRVAHHPAPARGRCCDSPLRARPGAR